MKKNFYPARLGEPPKLVLFPQDDRDQMACSWMNYYGVGVSDYNQETKTVNHLTIRGDDAQRNGDGVDLV